MLDIAELRKVTKLNQKKFADKYHINVSTLQKWESGKNKQPEHYLYAMNELFKCRGLIRDEKRKFDT